MILERSMIYTYAMYSLYTPYSIYSRMVIVCDISRLCTPYSIYFRMVAAAFRLRLKPDSLTCIHISTEADWGSAWTAEVFGSALFCCYADPGVCKVMAFWALFGCFGLLFYIL